MHDGKECNWTWHVIEGEWLIVGITCPECLAFFDANLRQMCKQCGKPIDDHDKDSIGMILRC